MADLESVHKYASIKLVVPSIQSGTNLLPAIVTSLKADACLVRELQSPHLFDEGIGVLCMSPSASVLQQGLKGRLSLLPQCLPFLHAPPGIQSHGQVSDC